MCTEDEDVVARLLSAEDTVVICKMTAIGIKADFWWEI